MEKLALAGDATLESVGIVALAAAAVLAGDGKLIEAVVSAVVGVTCIVLFIVRMKYVK